MQLLSMITPPVSTGIPLARRFSLMMVRRVIYLVAAMATLVVGLGSRILREELPSFLAEYAGDTLWALMLFLLVSTSLADRSILARAAISLSLAFLVELSQLYHAPWIDSIRQTTLGGLVLGFGFLWTDLICYSVGILTGSLIELVFRYPKKAE
jgi:hypothetical protein